MFTFTLRNWAFALSLLSSTAALHAFGADSAPAALIANDDRRYFAVCGKCDWISPYVADLSDAYNLARNHRSGQESTDHDCVVSLYSSEPEEHFTAVCGKCNWSSPKVDDLSHAYNLARNHHSSPERSGHTCSVIKL